MNKQRENTWTNMENVPLLKKDKLNWDGKVR